MPKAVRLDTLTEPDGSPLVMEIDCLAHVPLHVGCGYGGDPDWTDGSWRGTKWIEGARDDFTGPPVLKLQTSAGFSGRRSSQMPVRDGLPRN